MQTTMEDDFVDIDGEGDVGNDGDGYVDIGDTMEPYEQILQQALEESSQQDIKVETPEAESAAVDAKPFVPAPTAKNTSVPAMTMTTRRATRQAMTPPALDPSERSTRSSNQASRAKLQPKLKLKVSERQSSGISFLGSYDRELDSDDEDLTFEEHFILRLPPGDDCERLRAMVEKREMSKNVWLKFKGKVLLVMS